MCLPELQEPINDLPILEEEVVPEEPSDEDDDDDGNQSISDNDSSSDSSIGKCQITLEYFHKNFCRYFRLLSYLHCVSIGK